MKKSITLTNDFHNTEATVIPKWNSSGMGIVSRQAMTRAFRKLCGIAGCCCGGIRGRQEVDFWEIRQDGDYYVCRD